MEWALASTAVVLLLLGFMTALSRRRNAAHVRRTNHKFIPACYNQPPAREHLSSDEHE